MLNLLVHKVRIKKYSDQPESINLQTRLAPVNTDLYLMGYHIKVFKALSFNYFQNFCVTLNLLIFYLKMATT